jgi:hypothetical protein
MAQYAIIKNSTKAYTAWKTWYALTHGTQSYQFFFGNPIPWSTFPGGSYNDTNPAIPVDTAYNDKQIRDGIIGQKKIQTNEISLAISRVDWVSGQYYDMYRDDYDGSTVTGVSLTGEYTTTKPLSLTKSNAVVLVNDSGTYKVYMCIDNRSSTTGYPIPSTTKPTFTTNQIQTLVDGYKWRYLGSLSTGQVDDFLTTYHVPIPSTQPTGITLGAVTSIVMTSRGNGYTATPTVTVTGDGTGLTLGTPVLLGGAVAYIPVTAAGSGYTNIKITISGGGSPTTTATAKAILVDNYSGLLLDTAESNPVFDPSYLIVKAENSATDAYFTTRGNAPTVYSTAGVTDLKYRVVGLMSMDYSSATLLRYNGKEFRYNNSTGSFAYGDLLTSATSGLANSVATVVGTRQDTSTIIQTLTINAATAVNGSTNVITKATHNLVTGDTVLYSNGGGTSIVGLTNGNTYYAIYVSSSTFKLATSLSNAQSGSAIAITPGVGASHTLTQNAIKNYVSLLQTTEQKIDTLTAGKLFTKPDSSASLYLGPYTVFNGSSTGVVGVSTDILTIASHPFTTGDSVVYSNGGGTTITTTSSALVSGNTYYVIRVTSNEIKLATSLANANAGTAIDITAVGSGTSHSLTYNGSDYYYAPTSNVNQNIIFVEYRNAVTRSTSKEKFRFVLEF